MGHTSGNKTVHSCSLFLFYTRGVVDCITLHPSLGSLPEELLPVGGWCLPGAVRVNPTCCLFFYSSWAKNNFFTSFFGTLYHLWLLSFVEGRGEWLQQRPYVLQSLRCLLSGHCQSAGPWYRPSLLNSGVTMWLALANDLWTEVMLHFWWEALRVSHGLPCSLSSYAPRLSAPDKSYPDSLDSRVKMMRVGTATGHNEHGPSMRGRLGGMFVIVA